MADGSQVSSITAMPTVLLDTLVNLVSGLGTDRDKTMGNSFGQRLLHFSELENAYRFDWIARKIVMLPAYDMVRAGRSWQTKKNSIEAIEKEQERLGFDQKLLKAMIMGRLYGGAGLVVGTSGSPWEPLDIKSIPKGGIKWLLPISRINLSVKEYDFDMNSEGFGTALFYEMRSKNGRVLKIHRSRVIPFYGNEVPTDDFNSSDGWSDSILQAVADAVLNAGAAQAGIAGLIQEAKIDVVKIPGMMSNLSSDEYTTRLVSRFQLAATAKSSQNTLMLDSEEEWDRKQINFTQLPDILKLYLNIAAGAADIPATRLLGTSPVGMNATGESDIRQYYDKIAGDQVALLKPSLLTLDAMILQSALGRQPKDIFYVFNPLWQMSEEEKAKIGQTKAETANKWKDSGLIAPKVLVKMVENQIIEDALYPGSEAAFEEFEGKTGEGEQPTILLPEPEVTTPAPGQPAPKPTVPAQ